MNPQAEAKGHETDRVGDTRAGVRARKRTVQIAKRNALEALVEKGLDVGMRVIVYPADARYEGVRVAAR